MKAVYASKKKENLFEQNVKCLMVKLICKICIYFSKVFFREIVSI